MRYEHVHIAAIAHELPTEVLTTRAIEEKLVAEVRNFPLACGRLEATTGVRERRVWPRGARLADGAAKAGQTALEKANVSPTEVGALIYAGVCRDQFEPATACAVANELGISGATAVYDVSNACLGALTAMVDVANRIELGQIEAGLVVTNESARDIIDETIARLAREHAPASAPPPPLTALATFTGGSAACAVLLSRRKVGPRLLCATQRSAPTHHKLCTWGLKPTGPGLYEQVLDTDARSVLREGLALGAATWREFLKELDWTPATPDRVVTHQVGRVHQEEILRVLELDPQKDFVTFPFLGNTGSAALPTTLSIAAESGQFKSGDKVAMLGIGSGLSCLMMGVEW